MEDFRDYYLQSPITEVTRRVRRNLMITCVTAFLVIQGDFMPTNIPGLGIEIEEVHEKGIITILTLLIIYYLIKFYIYMQLDGKALMYKALKSYLGDNVKDLNWKGFKVVAKEKFPSVMEKYGKGMFVWVSARIFVDIIFPLLTGAGALWLLYTYQA